MNTILQIQKFSSRILKSYNFEQQTLKIPLPGWNKKFLLYF